ncbi:uncharacterized protein LOC121853809 isoform X3 [Homarus americanus]|nr:uncharacterized protein LOC121853809 isoform X3 [Homarus americanus]XP_042204120.1 uncharacterized protein LOC121853809 isoform X3 [Homarus americanus]
MDGPIIEELPMMRSMSPSTLFGERIEIDFSQTLIKGPTKTVEITPTEAYLPSSENIKNRKNKSSEDLALIEALWKQDVDLGVPREVYEDEVVETLNDAQTKDKDHGKKPKGDTKIDEKADDNLCLHLNFTIDSETGEHVLSPESQISGGDVTFEPVSSLNSPSFTLNETVADFNLEFNLDEALQFVGLDCSETGETVWKSSESENNSDSLVKTVSEKEEEESEDSLDVLNDTLDDMIQASQLHPHHPRSLQVNKSFVLIFTISLKRCVFKHPQVY